MLTAATGTAIWTRWRLLLRGLTLRAAGVALGRDLVWMA